MLLAFFRSRQRYIQLWESDTLPLCNLLIILQCLIWAESGNLRRARKSCCPTRFAVNKGEKRKTRLFSQQYEFKELYGVCILQEAHVGRKWNTVPCTQQQRWGFTVAGKVTAGRQWEGGRRTLGPSPHLTFRDSGVAFLSLLFILTKSLQSVSLTCPHEDFERLCKSLLITNYRQKNQHSFYICADFLGQSGLFVCFYLGWGCLMTGLYRQEICTEHWTL